MSGVTELHGVPNKKSDPAKVISPLETMVTSLVTLPVSSDDDHDVMAVAIATLVAAVRGRRYPLLQQGIVRAESC